MYSNSHARYKVFNSRSTPDTSCGHDHFYDRFPCHFQKEEIDLFITDKRCKVYL